MSDDIDADLDFIARRCVARMKTEIEGYTVPQLISGLQAALRVRLLLFKLREATQDHSNVGSAVRKYSGAFTAPDDANSRKKAPRRARPRIVTDTSHLDEFIINDDDE